MTKPDMSLTRGQLTAERDVLAMDRQEMLKLLRSVEAQGSPRTVEGKALRNLFMARLRAIRDREGYFPIGSVEEARDQALRWEGTSLCQRCGSRLTCPYCGQYVREDHLGSHECHPMTKAMDDFAESCPICVGGQGQACTSHFA